MMFFIYLGMALLAGALALYLKLRGSNNDCDLAFGILMWILAAGGVLSFAIAGIISALF